MKTLHLSTYAIIQSDLSRELKSHFAVHTSLIPELEEYRLVYWSASHLYKCLMINLEESRNFDYYIDRQNTLYSVVMQNCSIDSLYEIAVTDPDRQIRISFRRARKHWNLEPVAIIKLPAPRPKLMDLRDSKGNYTHD